LGNELTIELFVVDLILDDGVVDHKGQEKLSYEALSHHWEDLTNNSAVIVSSLSYPITQNLYVALQRLRSSNQHHYLWINALCINQHDLKERSMQVQNMLSIYKKATTVLFWLGECEQDTALCLTFVSPVYLEPGHQMLITMVQDSATMVWNLVTTCRSLATMVVTLITR
jgi:hypothetical protein